MIAQNEVISELKRLRALGVEVPLLGDGENVRTWSEEKCQEVLTFFSYLTRNALEVFAERLPWDKAVAGFGRGFGILFDFEQSDGDKESVLVALAERTGIRVWKRSSTSYYLGWVRPGTDYVLVS